MSTKLKQILEDYRNGERGLPTYEELQEIAEESPLGEPTSWKQVHINGVQFNIPVYEKGSSNG